MIGGRFAVIARTPHLLAAPEAQAWAAIDAVLLDAQAHPGLAGVLDLAGGDVAVVRPDRYLFGAGAQCPPPPPLLLATS